MNIFKSIRILNKPLSPFSLGLTSFSRGSLTLFSTLPAKSLTRRFSSTDPDAGKPTLNIDAFARSERLKRPVSPNLFIYQPQLTWYLSGFHRLTGCVLATGFYLGAVGYGLVPFSSETAVSLVHSAPYGVIIGLKMLAASTVFFHSFNGIRHLVWDTTTAMTLKGVYSTGYVVLGLTALFTFFTAFYY